ncbi:MAG: hypothetical protein PVH61_25845 [Candidatus Aminicenantes bacterium]
MVAPARAQKLARPSGMALCQHNPNISRCRIKKVPIKAKQVQASAPALNIITQGLKPNSLNTPHIKTLPVNAQKRL